MAQPTLLQAPPGVSQGVAPGQTYSVDQFGLCIVTNPADVAALIRAGFKFTFPQMVYPISVVLPNPKAVNPYLGNIIQSGNISLYTVPAGRRAIVGRVSLYCVGGASGQAAIVVNTAGAWYQIGTSSGYSAGNKSELSIASFYVAEQGEQVGVSLTVASQLNAFGMILEFDNTVSLFTPKAFLAQGNTLLYQVAAGKTALIMGNNGLGSFLPGVSSGCISILQTTGATRTYSGYLVPSGQAPASTNQIFGPTTAVSNAAPNNSTFFNAIIAALNSGDQIWLNSDSGLAPQLAWTTVIEF